MKIDAMEALALFVVLVLAAWAVVPFLNNHLPTGFTIP